MPEHVDIEGRSERPDPVGDNRALYVSVGATVIALGAIFGLIASSPWVTQREHNDLVVMMQTRDEELSKRVDACRIDLSNLREQVEGLRERVAKMDHDGKP